jgi:hypothetical protein
VPKLEKRENAKAGIQHIISERFNEEASNDKPKNTSNLKRMDGLGGARNDSRGAITQRSKFEAFHTLDISTTSKLSIISISVVMSPIKPMKGSKSSIAGRMGDTAKRQID